MGEKEDTIAFAEIKDGQELPLCPRCNHRHLAKTKYEQAIQEIKSVLIQKDCLRCSHLSELYGQAPKSSRNYWLMTELFMILHDGQDWCDCWENFYKIKTGRGEIKMDSQNKKVEIIRLVTLNKGVYADLNSDLEELIGISQSEGEHTRKLWEESYHPD